MTPEELVETIQELNLRSAILAETVNVMNLTGSFMNAEPDSPVEDQASKALEDRIDHLVKDHGELIGHIVMAMAVILVEAAEWERVQAWLTEAEEEINRRAEEIGYDPH